MLGSVGKTLGEHGFKTRGDVGKKMRNNGGTKKTLKHQALSRRCWITLRNNKKTSRKGEFKPKM
jgi:hypothetical protein